MKAQNNDQNKEEKMGGKNKTAKEVPSHRAR